MGQEIDWKFELLTGSVPVKPHAKVLRREKPGHIAVEFTNISIKDRDAIKAYIFARVRN